MHQLGTLCTGQQASDCPRRSRSCHGHTEVARARYWQSEWSSAGMAEQLVRLKLITPSVTQLGWRIQHTAGTFCNTQQPGCSGHRLLPMSLPLPGKLYTIAGEMLNLCITSVEKTMMDICFSIFACRLSRKAIMYAASSILSLISSY